MAYSRFYNSNWYIFWYAGVRFHKHQEMLACWHTSYNSDYRDNQYYDYLTIKKTIDGDWSVIDPKNIISSEDKEKAVIRMKEWIKRVDEMWNKKKRGK